MCFVPSSPHRHRTNIKVYKMKSSFSLVRAWFSDYNYYWTATVQIHVHIFTGSSRCHCSSATTKLLPTHAQGHEAEEPGTAAKNLNESGGFWLVEVISFPSSSSSSSSRSENLNLGLSGARLLLPVPTALLLAALSSPAPLMSLLSSSFFPIIQFFSSRWVNHQKFIILDNFKITNHWLLWELYFAFCLLNQLTVGGTRCLLNGFLHTAVVVFRFLKNYHRRVSWFLLLGLSGPTFLGNLSVILKLGFLVGDEPSAGGVPRTWREDECVDL